MLLDAQLYRAQREAEIKVVSYCFLRQGLDLKFCCNKTEGRIGHIGKSWANTLLMIFGWQNCPLLQVSE